MQASAGSGSAASSPTRTTSAATQARRPIYYEANVDYPLPANFSLLGHFGYSDGNGIETAYGQDNYFDLAAGVGYTWDHFDFSLKYVDGEDLETLRDTPRDISNSEAVVIFTVSTSFPWKKDGE